MTKTVIRNSKKSRRQYELEYIEARTRAEFALMLLEKSLAQLRRELEKIASQLCDR